MADSITRDILIAALPERVWAALADHEEFGKWFGCTLDRPFVPGTVSRGVETLHSHGDLPMALEILVLDPPRRLVARWPAYDFEAKRDLADIEPWTKIEFTLEPEGDGTRVTVTESGFDAISAPLGDRMAKENTGGWEEQLRNLATHVAGHAG